MSTRRMPCIRGTSRRLLETNARAVVDYAVQRPDHVGTVAELGALVLAVEERTLERRRFEAVLRPLAEQQQARDRRRHTPGMQRGEAQVHQQPGALVGVVGV